MSTWNQPIETIFRDCTFRGDKTDVLISNDANARLLNCTFEAGARLQLQSSSVGEIEDCKFVGGHGIAVVSGSRVQMDRIRVGASETIALQIVDSGHVTGSNNWFQGGQLATILVHGNSQAKLDSCTILNVAGPTVEVLSNAAPGMVVDLRNNWWGTTEIAQISAWIQDGSDDPDRGSQVLFEPILQQSVATPARSLSELKSLFADGQKRIPE